MHTTSAAPVAPASAFGPPFPWVFVDGEWVDADDARVSVHANAVSYGTGTFEGIRATWSPEREELYLMAATAHYRRLHRSARVLGLQVPLTAEELTATTAELLRRNEVRADAYLRPLYILTGEDIPVRMHGIPTRLSIAAWPVVGHMIDPRGIRATISARRRAPDVAVPSRAKLCGGYIGPAIAKTEAAAAGYDEALMLNVDGGVAEATTSNVFMRRGDEWVTPAVTEDILEGITRDQVMTLLAERTGRRPTERRIQPSELLLCDELLLCGTAALIVPVVEVDGRRIGDGRPGAATSTLLEDLRAIARRAGDRHAEWTSPVYTSEEGEA